MSKLIQNGSLTVRATDVNKPVADIVSCKQQPENVNPEPAKTVQIANDEEPKTANCIPAKPVPNQDHPQPNHPCKPPLAENGDVVLEKTSPQRRRSLKNENPDYENNVCHRRVSVPVNRTIPKKKIEYGTHVVAKSELWDTGSQHRCIKVHQKAGRVNVNQEEGNCAEFLYCRMYSLQ